MHEPDNYTLNFAIDSLRGDRAENQDCADHYIDEQQAVFMVADGLGGHKNGRYAAHYFCERFLHQIDQHSDLLYKDPARILIELYTLAEHDLVNALQEYPDRNEARTTCVIAYVSDQQTISLHLGDSRFYLSDKNEILWCSKDHSVIQILLDQKTITQEEALTHPDRNRIYKCLGGSPASKAAIQQHPALKESQIIVLSSDGFWHTLNHEKINELIEACDLNAVLRKLTQQAVNDGNGKSDNVTAIAIRLEST